MKIKVNKYIIFILIMYLSIYFTGCTTEKSKATNTFSNSSSSSQSALNIQNSSSKNDTINEDFEFKPMPQVTRFEEYNGPIYHIFFHALIAFPDIAYSKVAGSGSFDIDCVTVTEFKKCLEELYKNNFILIDIHSTYEQYEENSTKFVRDKKLMLPKGKKPLIMSIDDMVYDPLKMGLGMVDKIILDNSGNFATYTKHKNGKEIISTDNEIIPILEQFVKQHPDFSFKGAKATLALTGWVGILGYRIDRLAPNRESEIQAVKPIVQKLKESGWTFASHGYGHRHSNQISYALFQDDTEKWHNEIEPLVGPTDIYVYPYGEKLSINDPKYKLLLQYNFKLMCGVSMSPSWVNYKHSIFMDRQAIDGYSLRNYKQYISPLMNTSIVFDVEGRKLH